MANDTVTELLKKVSGGDKDAEDELIRRVYRELHELAAACLRRERGGHTLQATALVHEAYFRLTGQREIDWANRHHFFGIAAKVMRRILVDYGRKRRAGKRGGGAAFVPLDEIDNLLSSRTADERIIVDLDDALTSLAKFAPRQARIVELRFFGGLEEQQIAQMLEISERTVKRDWAAARAWLFGELEK
jgi:RNA polymerase sigma factor (TIGR02999 family)